jgi:hypothetical protein
MNWYAQLRVLGLARRGVIALEKIADAQTLLAAASTRVERPKPKPTEFSMLDLAAVNKQWHADRKAAMEEGEGEESA